MSSTDYITLLFMVYDVQHGESRLRRKGRRYISDKKGRLRKMSIGGKQKGLLLLELFVLLKEAANVEGGWNISVYPYMQLYLEFERSNGIVIRIC